MKKEKDLYQIFLQYRSVNTDSRKIKKGDIFFAISGENFNANTFADDALKMGASFAVLDDIEIFNKLQKKWSNQVILTTDCLNTLQNLASCYRNDLDIPFLGITGSNGKTTTKELIREVLNKNFNVLATQGNLNNHIGVPLTILSITEAHTFAVIEMGASHIGEIKILADIAKPNFGIITNIGLAHIGEFKSFENIVKTKKELYDEVFKNKGTIFINPSDQLLAECSLNFPAKQKIFYPPASITPSKEFLSVLVNGNTISTKLSGEYNAYNIASAVCVGNFFSVPQQDIKTALENYIPTNNRSQVEKTVRGNEVVWDCYNSNPSSLSLSLQSFNKQVGDKVYILGDMRELGKFSKKEHELILSNLQKEPGLKILVGEEFSLFKEKYSEYIFLKDVNTLKEYLSRQNFFSKNILVKGSNGIKLFDIKNLI